MGNANAFDNSVAARHLLDELIQGAGTTYAAMSILVNRNETYIQQYIKRGSPVRLKAEDEKRLADFFGLPSDFLTSASAQYPIGKAAIAAVSIRRGLALVDELGLDQAGCRLQHGLDLLYEEFPALTDRR